MLERTGGTIYHFLRLVQKLQAGDGGVDGDEVRAAESRPPTYWMTVPVPLSPPPTG